MNFILVKKMNFREEIEKTGAIQKGHFPMSSGGCTDKRINSEYIYKNDERLRMLMGMKIARAFKDDIRYVVGVANGGNTLAEWVAHALDALHRNKQDREQTLWIPSEKTGSGFTFDNRIMLVEGKEVVVVDDVLSSGGNVSKVIQIVRDAGGVVAGVGIIYNRGIVLASKLGVPVIESVVSHYIKSWPKDRCQLCKSNVPYDDPDNSEND